jgi:ABC-type transport system involved in multi-copper enzyme maturation permease subunit
MTTLAARFARRPPLLPGITAIVVKDLRGRMRGRRAFVILTIYLLLLAGFGWMVERLSESTVTINTCFGCGGQATFASATVGQGVFVGLMFLQTLVVSVLSPASTAGAISGEREHQTLDLLAVTPISSLAIVLGKLLSALAWVFVLILASIPITGLVFIFGGVAPDDLVRGYVILFATAIGLGSVGLFFSALLKRTGASTGLTFVATIVLSIGSLFIWAYSAGTSIGANGIPKQPPEAILYLNPFVAQADVACGTESGFGFWCGIVGTVTGGNGSVFPNATDTQGSNFGGKIIGPVPIGGAGVVTGPPPDVAQAFGDVGSLRDRFWPKTVASFLVLALILTLASVQLVTPTRRWRPAFGSSLRRLGRRIHGQGPTT